MNPDLQSFELPAGFEIDPDCLPGCFVVEQHFESPVEGDLDTAVQRELATFLPRVAPGQTVAITAGSRTVAHLDRVIAAAARLIRRQGATAFVVPAMGSHGGATPEGQTGALRHLNGVTLEAIGCEIRSSLDVIEVGRTPSGFRVFTDRIAAEADWVIVLNRVKPHTLFSGTVESGLCKMLVIGLGNQVGAASIHRHALRRHLGETIVDATRVLIEAGRPKVLCGLAVVENARKEIARLAAVAMDQLAPLLREEGALLELARDLMPSLPFEEADALIMNEIGKDVSGSGMDTTVIGRKAGLTTPRIGAIYVRRLSEATDGNAIGIGYADIVHRDIATSTDVNATYVNAVTARRLSAVRIPVVVSDDLQALRILALHTDDDDPSQLRLVWIDNTLALSRFCVSGPLAEELATHDRAQVVSGPHRISIAADGSASIPDIGWC